MEGRSLDKAAKREEENLAPVERGGIRLLTPCLLPGGEKVMQKTDSDGRRPDYSFFSSVPKPLTESPVKAAMGIVAGAFAGHEIRAALPAG